MRTPCIKDLNRICVDLKSIPKLEKAIKVPWLENKEIEIIWTA